MGSAKQSTTILEEENHEPISTSKFQDLILSMYMASYIKVKFVGSFMSILSTSTIVLIWTFMPQISKNYIQIKFGNQYYIHFLRKEIFLLGCYNLSCISLFCGGLFQKRKIFFPWFVIQMFIFGNLICWIQLFVPGLEARKRDEPRILPPLIPEEKVVGMAPPPNFEKPVIFPPIPDVTMEGNIFDEDIVKENEFNMNLTTPIPDDFKDHSNYQNVTMDDDIIPEKDFNMDLTLLWILLGINGGLYGILLIIYGFKLKNSKKKKNSQNNHSMVFA